MKGGIFSDQKCAVCGGILRHVERRAGLFCDQHPKIAATRFKVRFGSLTKRFQSYEAAARFLNGVRFKTDEQVFDERDYRRDAPLGFANLADKWLAVKAQEVKIKSHNNLQNYMGRAKLEWGNTNIKTIGYAEIEDFLFGQEISPKTRSNMRSAMHSFWQWLRRRKVLTPAQIPEFPEISFELGWRQTVDRTTQQAIIDEVERISRDVDPKIWLGIRFLATYISIRPGELIRICERHIDLESGILIIPAPKEKRPKLVPLIQEDIQALKSFPRGLPDLAFFRHPVGISGCRPGEPYGQRYLYKWWKKACENLGVAGVDMYGGTRHSTAMALKAVATPEQIRAATMHSTNKAFERYYKTEINDVRKVYEQANGLRKADNTDNKADNGMTTEKAPAQILKLPK